LSKQLLYRLQTGMTILARTVVLTVVIAVGAVALPGDGARAAPAEATESQIQAVFLFNFARFVQWPEGAFAAGDAPFHICILGTDPFGRDLDEVVAGETVGGHPMAVRRLDQADDVGGCHIAYVDSTDAGRFRAALAAVQDHPTLLVSDLDRAAEQGAIIQFHRDGNRVRLRINLAAARSAGLTISSKLLRPATVINAGKG
jgi:hypothetical protein